MRKRHFSWLNPRLKVKKNKKNTNGIFANKNLKRNELLTIFGGYAMTLREFDRLPEKLRHFPSQILEEFVFGVKKESEADDAEYFNHSCNPNAGFGGQIFLRAMRNIKSGEEVTFDYAMTLYPSKTKAPKGKDPFDKLECDCGSKNCRLIITENDWKISKLQKKYDGYFQWFIQEKINKAKKI